MSVGKDEEEKAAGSFDAADISSLGVGSISPRMNAEETEDSPSVLNPWGEKQDSAPADSASSSADGEDDGAVKFQVPQILPLGMGYEDEPSDQQDAGEDAQRVWGNQAGGRVYTEHLSTVGTNASFDVSKISVKKTDTPSSSRSRRGVFYVLGAVLTLLVVGFAVYASGILQTIFTVVGADSPIQGAKSYYQALIDKDAQSLCALSSPAARGELVAAINQSQEGNTQSQGEVSVKECAKAANTAFAGAQGNSSIKLSDLVFSLEKSGDIDQVKAVLIKDKKGTSLQIMGWQSIDGRWFLAAQDSQQKVDIQYRKSQAGGSKGAK